MSNSMEFFDPSLRLLLDEVSTNSSYIFIGNNIRSINDLENFGSFVKRFAFRNLTNFNLSSNVLNRSPVVNCYGNVNSVIYLSVRLKMIWKSVKFQSTSFLRDVGERNFYPSSLISEFSISLFSISIYNNQFQFLDKITDEWNHKR